ncbi:Segregation and condensation protein B [Corynebacterium glaucum]|uniref:Segregation and condensation protein B n=1 Tax=Corynebacterium glaucum TaxID=187491 RepID=A0A1Q2HWG5_9CORY|nr:SMC-Scp complex subunit ScpB [Corynebacterium glaucum]AQQ15197.1 Segregation and condensation protein B [Corynebacterium glaucum]WJZ07694.1 Segregation and condensation protein B [Corynebacterium glaucum]
MSLPDHSLPMVSQLRSRIESILLVVETPVMVAELAEVLGASPSDVDKQLLEWANELDARGSGIELRETAEGWRLYTRPENAEAVESFVLDGAQTKLSRAAMETLAVIAYRQPVTRAQVAGVRGVNVDGVMRTLTLRGLIAEVDPDEATGAHRYVTTELFLELLGIDSLDRLPDLAPLLPEVDAIEDAW